MRKTIKTLFALAAFAIFSFAAQAASDGEKAVVDRIIHQSFEIYAPGAVLQKFVINKKGDHNGSCSGTSWWGQMRYALDGQMITSDFSVSCYKERLDEDLSAALYILSSNDPKAWTNTKIRGIVGGEWKEMTFPELRHNLAGVGSGAGWTSTEMGPSYRFWQGNPKVDFPLLSIKSETTMRLIAERLAKYARPQ